MTERIRVKVCGITRPGDAALAAALGADAIGMIFWHSSPRAVDVTQARAISSALPPFVTRVGVFVNPDPAEVRRMVSAVGLDVVQLHGDEDVAAFENCGARLVRVVTLERPEDVDAATALPPAVTPLVDAADPVRRGGTGRRADWTLAARLARQRPIVLAGGLTAENVGEALERVRPWGVDVSSGVESAPGIKSADRLRAWFEAISMGRQART